MTVAGSCYGAIFVFGLNMTKLIFPIKRNVLFYVICKIVVLGFNEEIDFYKKQAVLFYGNCKIDHKGHEGMLLILFTKRDYTHLI